MTKLNNLHSKHSTHLYDLDISKQRKVKGGTFSNSFDSNKSMSGIFSSSKFSSTVNGKKITDLKFNYTVVNSAPGVNNQVNTTPGSQVIIDGKKY